MNKPKLRRECYARRLGGCDGGISEEHVLSKGILDDDFSFHYRDQTHDIALHSNAMTLQFLCRKHNRDLSPYDSEAIKFFRALRHFLLGHQFPQLNVEDDGTTKLVRINGKKLEKWFAKTLFNIAAYKGVRGLFSSPVGDVNNTHILKYLFEDEEILQDFGLYQLRFGTNVLPPTQFAQLQVSESSYMTGSKTSGPKEGPYVLPGILYLNIAGLEFVGNFNITHLSNEARNTLVFGEEFSRSKFMIGAVRKPEALIMAPLDYAGKLNPETPPVKISIEWD